MPMPKTSISINLLLCLAVNVKVTLNTHSRRIFGAKALCLDGRPHEEKGMGWFKPDY